ncbi:MAG: hypothetical protein WCB12_22585 [Bryobacteraceae bacterium]
MDNKRKPRARGGSYSISLLQKLINQELRIQGEKLVGNQIIRLPYVMETRVNIKKLARELGIL